MNKVFFGDCRVSMRQMIAEGVKVQMCVTSPPYYGLRDYCVEGQLGHEESPDNYVQGMVEVFRLVRELLVDDGTLWLNLGDSYAANRSYQVNSTKGGAKHGPGQSVNGKGSIVPEGLKPKDLLGIPWRVAFALQADGWYLRQDIIWHKPNVMPESVKDRCTKSHEYLFLLTKSERYLFNLSAIKEKSLSKVQPRKRKNGLSAEEGKKLGVARPNCGVSETRRRRSVWSINTERYGGAHCAVFPIALVEPCILGGSRPGDVVFDPFMGSGTTAQVAVQHGRQYLGCELNAAYKTLQDERIASPAIGSKGNVMKAKKVVIVAGDDWKGLYLNGKLVMEGHDLKVTDVLEFFGIKHEVRHADLSWLGDVGSLPTSLSEVKLEERKS